MSVVAYPLNNTDYTAEDAMLYNCSRTSGVLDEDGNLEISVTDDREVTISVGIAWIRYKKLAGLAVGVRGAEILTVAVSDSTLGRIDTVVLGYSAADNGASLYIKQGTPSSTPAHPTLTKSESLYELGLYDIKVAAGSTTVSVSDITDTRGDDDRCGYMREIGAALLRTLDDYAKLTSPSFKGGITVDGKIIGNGDAAVSGALTVGGKSTFNGAAAFTQSPTVPTADKTDDSTKAANTAFVKQVAGGGTRTLVATFTSSGTFNPATYPSIGNKYDVEMCGGGQGGMPNSVVKRTGTSSTTYYNYYGYGGNAGETIRAFGVYIPSSIFVVIGAGGSIQTSGFIAVSGNVEGITSCIKGGDTSIPSLGLLARGGGYSVYDVIIRGATSTSGYSNGVIKSLAAWIDTGSFVSSVPDIKTAGVSLLGTYGNGGTGGYSKTYDDGESSTGSHTGGTLVVPTAGTSGIVKIYAYQ